MDYGFLTLVVPILTLVIAIVTRKVPLAMELDTSMGSHTTSASDRKRSIPGAYSTSTVFSAARVITRNDRHSGMARSRSSTAAATGTPDAPLMPTTRFFSIFRSSDLKTAPGAAAVPGQVSSLSA